MVTAIYLSLVNFNFELLEVAKINGARPWRAFIEITWPLNWIGTAIGLVLVFIPCLASAVTPRFLGGPQATSFGMSLAQQFGETGTWALGSAMGVVPVPRLAAWSSWSMRRTIDLQAQRLHRSARRNERGRAALGPRSSWASLLVGLYVFLYAPIFYVIYTSFAADIVWPFPPAFSASAYDDLFDSSLYGDALRNSLDARASAARVLSTVLATGGAIGVLRYPLALARRWRCCCSWRRCSWPIC